MREIDTVIGPELNMFSEYFNDIFRDEVELLDKILIFLSQYKGKQMRPMFVLLSAKICGTINDATYRSALFVEMIHTSSLLHDDVVDMSLQRRGRFSVNALWNNKIAVSVGDNLFARAISLLLENQDLRVLKILSNSIEKVVSGELLQMEKAKRINFSEEVYYEIIKRKTASLLASACAAGVASSVADEDLIDRFYSFGEKVGMAFQIKDDLLDYSDFEIGKPKGKDIKEGKVTLPLLYALNNSAPALRKEMFNVIKSRKISDEKIDWLISKMKNLGGFEYAETKMMNFLDEALIFLHSFPESDTRRALEFLVNYVINRKK